MRVTVSSLSVTGPPRRLRFQPSIAMRRRADRRPAPVAARPRARLRTSRSMTNSMHARVVDADLRNLERVGRVDGVHLDAGVRVAGQQHDLVLRPAVARQPLDQRRLQRRRKADDVDRDQRELLLAVGEDQRLGEDAIVYALGRAIHPLAIAAQRRLQFQGRRQIDARHAGLQLGGSRVIERTNEQSKRRDEHQRAREIEHRWAPETRRGWQIGCDAHVSRTTRAERGF